MLRFGRRAFLRGIAFISPVLGNPKRAIAQTVVAPPMPSSLQATLEAVIDTIVPRDQDPGAVDAGVPVRIIAHLSTHREAQTLYLEGLELVDRLARQTGASSFAALPGPRRERLLSSLGSSPGGPGKVGEAFLIRARRDVLAFFWGSVTGQRVVEYLPPLSGYPEYADPPSPVPRRKP